MLDVTKLQIFGFDYFCTTRKYLVWNLISRNLKIKYKRSILGVFWTLVMPLAMASIYFFAFKIVLKIPIPDYVAMIICGILPWMFFSQSVSEGTEQIVAQTLLVIKIPIPLQVFPFVGVLTNFTTLLFGLPVMFAAAAIWGVGVTPIWILSFYYLICLFFCAYSISLILSIVYVFLRDLKHIVALILQIWFYATPVLYDEQMIPDKYQWILYANPVGKIFTGLRETIVRGTVPSALDATVVTLWTVFFILLSVFCFKRSKNLAEYL